MNAVMVIPQLENSANKYNAIKEQEATMIKKAAIASSVVNFKFIICGLLISRTYHL